jgi:hypothetical protein
MPNLLHLAIFAREFADAVQFTRRPWIAQGILFGLLTPLAGLSGHRGSYPGNLTRGPSSRAVRELSALPNADAPHTQKSMLI